MKLLALVASLFVLTSAEEAKDKEDKEEILEHQIIGSDKCPENMSPEVYCEACLHMVDHAITSLIVLERQGEERNAENLEKVWYDMCSFDNFDKDFLYQYAHSYGEHVCQQLRIDYQMNIKSFLAEIKTENTWENRIDQMNQFCGYGSMTNACRNVKRNDPEEEFWHYNKIQFQVDAMSHDGMKEEDEDKLKAKHDEL